MASSRTGLGTLTACSWSPPGSVRRPSGRCSKTCRGTSTSSPSSAAQGPADLVLRDEIAELVDVRGGQLHEVIGSRTQAPLDEAVLRRLVPDIAQRDVYMCGPRPFTHGLRAAVRALGVPPKRIHREDFVF